MISPDLFEFVALVANVLKQLPFPDLDLSRQLYNKSGPQSGIRIRGGVKKVHELVDLTLLRCIQQFSRNCNNLGWHQYTLQNLLLQLSSRLNGLKVMILCRNEMSRQTNIQNSASSKFIFNLKSAHLNFVNKCKFSTTLNLKLIECLVQCHVIQY